MSELVDQTIEGEKSTIGDRSAGENETCLTAPSAPRSRFSVSVAAPSLPCYLTVSACFMPHLDRFV